jgi:hypothetical protein
LPARYLLFSFFFLTILCVENALVTLFDPDGGQPTADGIMYICITVLYGGSATRHSLLSVRPNSRNCSRMREQMLGCSVFLCTLAVDVVLATN